MLHVPQTLADSRLREQRFETAFADGQRKAAQVLASLEEQIEGEENEILRGLFRQRGLQYREAGNAAAVERDDLAVDQAVRERFGIAGDGGELPGPIDASAGADDPDAVVNAQLCAVSIELDLMTPSRLRGRAIDQLAELRFDEARDGFHGHGFGRRRTRILGPRGVGPSGAAASGADRAPALRIPGGAMARPDRVGRHAILSVQHERFRGRSLGRGDLPHGTSRSDRTIDFQQCGGRGAGLRAGVPVFDQQPVVALPAVAVAAHADQHPAAMQPRAVQGELQIAALEGFSRGLRALRRPISAIPKLHRAAAVFTLGDGALEISVFERMIFHFDCQALVGRIDGGSARDRPGFEDAVEFEPEVVVETAGGVLLDDEAEFVG